MARVFDPFKPPALHQKNRLPHMEKAIFLSIE